MGVGSIRVVAVAMVVFVASACGTSTRYVVHGPKGEAAENCVKECRTGRNGEFLPCVSNCAGFEKVEGDCDSVQAETKLCFADAAGPDGRAGSDRTFWIVVTALVVLGLVVGGLIVVGGG